MTALRGVMDWVCLESERHNIINMFTVANYANGLHPPIVIQSRQNLIFYTPYNIRIYSGSMACMANYGKSVDILNKKE